MSTVPSVRVVHTAQHVRHTNAIGAASQPSDTSPCGTCSCSNDGNGGMVTVDDQGYPCQGGGTSGGAGGSGGATGDGGSGGSPSSGQSADPCTADPSQPSCVQLLAEAPGKPTGSCQQTDGSPSLAVGTTLGSVTDANGQHVRSVVDVNQVNALNSQTILNSQKVANNFASVGWIYLDDQGGMWFQKDQQALWTTAYSINFNKYFGIAITPPPGQNPVIIAKPPTTSPIGSNIQTVKCWKDGSALVPGTLG